MSGTATIDQPVTTTDTAFLEVAKEFLAIRSTYERPTELKRALEFIVERIEQYPDIHIERFENNGLDSILAYKGEKRPERFKVLLHGHVDVVPGKDEEFHPYIKDNRMYGRGSLDMKVSLLLMVEAFCKAVREVSYPLGLQVTSDEEIGGYGGAAHQFKQGVRGDFVITGEQSANDVVIAAKGICWLKIQQSGTSSHGAYLWKGDNALLKLTELVQKIHDIYPVPEEESWETTASVAQLHATTEGFFNRVPDAAELLIDFRFLPGDPNFATKDAVRAFIASLDKEAQIEFVTFEGGPLVEASNPFLQKLIASTNKYKKIPSQMIRRYANSDLRHMLSDPDMRGVEYGVGGGSEHSDDEYVDLESVFVMRHGLQDFLQSVQSN